MTTNREVLETWFNRVWTQQDTTAIDELLVPDGQVEGLGANVLVGPDGFKQFHSALSKLLTDFVITIDKSIESEEWLSAVCSLRAKDQKTAGPVTITGSVMARIVNGKITEAYNHWDFIGLFSQVGLLPGGTFEKALSGEIVA